LKKFYIIIITLICLAPLLGKANSNADLFEYNESIINNCIAGIDESTTIISFEKTMQRIAPPEINDTRNTAFAWGFCCWPVGIFTIVNKEGVTKEELKAYSTGWAVGCVASVVAAYAAFYFLLLNYTP
jgi:hypothetical protein